MSFRIKEYFYHLPSELIANIPVEPRDHCRLMLVDRKLNKVSHQRFFDIKDLLGKNDVLVLNQSKVFPARLLGNKSTGGQIELLLFHQLSDCIWESISKPGLKLGTKLVFANDLIGEVIERKINTGEVQIRFNQKTSKFFNTLDLIGLTPIPHYINCSVDENKLRSQYQTVYAKNIGSAAAPTAGLHFTQELIGELKRKGVQIEYVTLHVGLGTFKPLSEENLKSGKLHQEFYEIDPETANRLNMARTSGKRIIAVGTTSIRTLESAVKNIDGRNLLIPGASSTQLFIKPPYKFNFTDGLITNFHLPESSLLMLVTAFTCHPNTPCIYKKFTQTLIGNAYKKAVDTQYRFFSFGDAMFVF